LHPKSAPFGVRVNAIVPSIVETALVAPLQARPEIWNVLASHRVFNRWAPGRGGRRGRVSRLRCRELHHWHGVLGRWRLDRNRWRADGTDKNPQRRAIGCTRFLLSGWSGGLGRKK
jgi:hypothetical protein